MFAVRHSDVFDGEVDDGIFVKFQVQADILLGYLYPEGRTSISEL